MAQESEAKTSPDRPYVVTMEFFAKKRKFPNIFEIGASLIPKEYRCGTASMKSKKCHICSEPTVYIYFRRPNDSDGSAHHMCKNGHNMCWDRETRFKENVPTPPDTEPCKWKWSPAVIDELNRITAQTQLPATPS